MKAEYDFSKGERGKFYSPDARLNSPVYLDPDVEQFLVKFARAKNIEVDTIVNQWLRNNIKSMEVIL